MQKWLIEQVVYPLMERWRGNRVRELLQQLQKSAARPAADLRELQRQRLTRLLLHVKENCPAYRDLAWDQQLIHRDPYAALRQIPPLDKNRFRRHSELYLTRPVSELIANRTGGSSGDPVRFYMDRAQVEAYEAARWRGLSWYGITPGSRCLMLWGNPIELAAQARWQEALRERLLKNRRLISAYTLSADSMGRLARTIDRFRPEYLYGYAGSLVAVGRMLALQGLRPRRRLKAVVATAEALSPEDSQVLEMIFNCPVVNEYGARDGGIIAYSCPEGSLHLSAENLVLEILDPITLEPLPPGSSGLIALTDLTNFCQPRLRYLLGDAGALADGPCSCQLPLPCLAALDGREDAILVTPRGRLVHGNMVRQLVKAYDGVASFQLEQLAPERALLRIKLEEGWAAAPRPLLDKIGRALPGVDIRVLYVDEIAPEASGKFRCAVRRFELKH